MPDDAPQLTEADFTEFAQQLYEWTKTLPEVQQGLLHRILARAATAETDDTSGYALNTYFKEPGKLEFPNLVRGAAGLNVDWGDGFAPVAGIKDGTSNTLQ